MPKRNVGRREALKGLAALAAVPFLPEAGGGETRPPAQSAPARAGAPAARDLRFDDGWRFHLGDAAGAERADFDDSAWRRLDLPHDWSIEDLPPRPESNGEAALWEQGATPRRVGPFDADASPGQTATGFVLGGTGWYRKRFRVARPPGGARAEICFDGVYMDADVWLNGRHLGSHPYGYTPFAFDLTPHLKAEGENVLAVRVRNEGKNSRWYSGSGIYRPVWLTTTGDVRVARWGTAVTTELARGAAKVNVLVKVENHSAAEKNVNVRLRLFTPGGGAAGEAAAPLRLAAGQAGEARVSVNLDRPRLWSTESPSLYQADVQVVEGGRLLDGTSTAFGVRSVSVSAEEGLRINGEPVKLRGACLHHDNGVLGAAAVDRAEERRVEIMKANGYNAIRCSHNPPSAAFLDACDRLGVVVIDEAFDQWRAAKNPQDYHRFFDEWWRRDVESMVLRDRNHPSVIMWSIGNEIHERAEPEGVELAERLAGAIKRLDPTRPVTAAICSFWDYPPGNRPWAETDPAFKHLDVGGYNYAWREYEKDHARQPRRVMVGTESFPLEAFENWRAVVTLPYVVGDFVWTGMDYLGETGIGHVSLKKEEWPEAFSRPFPWFNAFCGDIDLIGGKKPQSYFRDVVWGRSRLEMAVQRPVPEGKEESVSLWGWSDELRSWTWPGFEGRTVKVRVYSSAERVRLLLNGREVGTKPVSAETRLRAEFEVPYAPGELRAVAFEGGREVASLAFKTAGEPAALRLVPDRTALRAERGDLCYVTVEVLDAAGQLVPDAVVPVAFEVGGAGELAAVGSANPKDAASFRKPLRKTFHGKCLAVLRPAGARGAVTLRASSEGLAPGELMVRVG